MSAIVAAVVRDALSSATAVTALVGSGASFRCYASYRPGTSLPAIVLTYGEDRDLSPSHQRTDRVRRLDISIDCVGETLAQSRTLAEAVRVALHGASGTGRSSTQVFEIRVLSCSTEFDIGAEGTEPETHITSVRAECTYRSPAVSPVTITDPNGPIP